MSDWQETTLGEICSIEIGGTPSRSEERYWWKSDNDGVRFPWVSISDMKGKVITDTKESITEVGAMQSNCKHVPKGTLLMSFKLTIGRLAFAGRDLYTNEAISAIRPTRDVYPEFLYYGLQHWNLTGDSDQAVKGVTLNKQKLQEIPCVIPPLPEQKKIAETLSGIDNAIARTKCKIQKLDALQFSLTEEFTQDLQGNLEPSLLEEYAEVRTGVAKNSNNEGDMVEMPYMRVANVQDGYLDLSEIKEISIDRRRIERYLLRKGDVLINEGGDLDKVGRGVIWHEQVKQCLHQNHVFAVRCSDQLMPEFLSLYLKSSHSKNYFIGCAKQTTNLASINSTQLKSFPIPVPPLNEQRKFVEHIRSVRDLSLAIAAEMSALEAMKKAVASDLLSGRKRVSM